MNYERLNDLRLLGLTIAYYRRAKGMTQAELAEAVHISRTHMNLYFVESSVRYR